MKHKHYDVIVAFAEGKAIQYRRGGEWCDWATPLCPVFSDTEVYRIKPQKSWRWVVKSGKSIAVSAHYFSSTEELETKHPHLIALQPVLCTEKEE